MKELALYTYTHEDFNFGQSLESDLKEALDKHPDKYQSLEKHLNKSRGHTEDNIREVFNYRCTLPQNILESLQKGDIVWPIAFVGKDRIGADLCDILNNYSELVFVYMFKEFSEGVDYNFKVVDFDNRHEAQEKLLFNLF